MVAVQIRVAEQDDPTGIGWSNLFSELPDGVDDGLLCANTDSFCVVGQGRLHLFVTREQAQVFWFDSQDGLGSGNDFLTRRS